MTSWAPVGAKKLGDTGLRQGGVDKLGQYTHNFSFSANTNENSEEVNFSRIMPVPTRHPQEQSMESLDSLLDHKKLKLNDKKVGLSLSKKTRS